MIGPGKTIGIVGGGQLGRMTALAARRMGYRIHVYEPGENSPAGQVADVEINASYRDEPALARFLRGVDVVTFEFENIPAAFLRQAAESHPVYPSPEALLICQNREREKLFLRENGFPHAPFEVVTGPAELKEAARRLEFPCVLKTAAFGYDGKGQVKLEDGADLEAVWKEFSGERGVLEKWVSFENELSAICAVRPGGQGATFPVSENIHTDHILEYSIVPARLDEEICRRAAKMAGGIAAALQLNGLLAVEFFLTGDDDLLVNELAPRPHNSGHYSFDACLTSQFEQHVRAVCDLPLGETRLLMPVVMVNLLGDLWKHGVPDWERVLRHPMTKLHLYGKEEPRPGRKMGHFCVMADSVEEAYDRARAIKETLAQ